MISYVQFSFLVLDASSIPYTFVSETINLEPTQPTDPTPYTQPALTMEPTPTSSIQALYYGSNYTCPQEISVYIYEKTVYYVC